MSVPTEMLDALRRLVEAESFSSDPGGLERCALVLRDLGREILGSPLELRGKVLRWERPGDRPVLVLCHYDTVWPTGTLARFPFEVRDGVARGPGVFDMKAGIVQALYAIRNSSAPVTLLLTHDEERGSPESQEAIEREALASRAALVLEPASEGGAVKLARKGVAHWKVEVKGRAAHAGLEPQKGVNAALELARQVERIAALGDPTAGTTVTVTMLGAGSAENVVPEEAWCRVDARMWTREEAERLERVFSDLGPLTEGAHLSVSGGMNRGPMEREASQGLYERLRALGYDLPAAEVGGGSDGNFTAALGVPTLDGLGAVGGGAHARDEHVLVDEMPARAEMVARLIDDLAEDA
ncbi:MAG TPA: M20 family metallopeptidase [Actinomycetota bacterium]|nr:M20 family metallopeptidase [Actinomycetota bacterium]